MFLFISGAEIFIILVIVVMLFGADKLPELARGLGKGMQQLKSATNEVKKEITESAKKQGIDASLTSDIQKDIKKMKTKVQDNIDDLTGPIKRNSCDSSHEERSAPNVPAHHPPKLSAYIVTQGTQNKN